MTTDGRLAFRSDLRLVAASGDRLLPGEQILRGEQPRAQLGQISAEAVLLDVDGTIVDGHDDDATRLVQRLRVLTTLGVPVALVTGKRALKACELFVPAAFPGLRVYGRNGMEGRRAVDGTWEEMAPVVDPATLPSEAAAQALAESVMRACATDPVLALLVTSVGSDPTSRAVTVRSLARGVPWGSIDACAVVTMLADALGDVALPEGYTLVVADDAVQFLPTALRKGTALARFAEAAGIPPDKVCRIGDQGGEGGNDEDILRHPLGYSVGTAQEGVRAIRSGQRPTEATCAVIDACTFPLSPEGQELLCDAVEVLEARIRNVADEFAAAIEETRTLLRACVVCNVPEGPHRQRALESISSYPAESFLEWRQQEAAISLGIRQRLDHALARTRGEVPEHARQWTSYLSSHPFQLSPGAEGRRGDGGDLDARERLLAELAGDRSPMRNILAVSCPDCRGTQRQELLGTEGVFVSEYQDRLKRWLIAFAATYPLAAPASRCVRAPRVPGGRERVDAANAYLHRFLERFPEYRPEQPAA